MCGLIKMLKNRNIICISSIDWDFIWQGHQEIMSRFAKNGNKVLFIENTGIRIPSFRDIPRLRRRIINWYKSIKGFRKESENLFIYSPLVLPFPYSMVARWINKYMLLKPLKRWMKVMEFYEPIIWTFLPTGTALDIINNIDRKILVYYCIADFSKLVTNPRKVKKTEDELFKKCDLIFVQGEALRDKCAKLNNNVHIFPFGVRIEDFQNLRYSQDRIKEDIKNIKKPVIGYVGGIHKHIDFELLEVIAKNNPDWSIVLIGPVQTNVSRIANLKNIFLLGQKEFSELPYYINEFSVGIIPYRKSGYTETVYPTKLNEYHALGKPVVSTDLPEIVNFNSENGDLVIVADTYEEFVKNLSTAIQNSGNKELISRRVASAKKNSWAQRLEEMSGLIEDAMERKISMPADWIEKLIKIYKATTRKILKTAVIALSLYFTIFYTPLIWFLASPLKIVQKPQAADSIVVFAGGVGESGKAGQGYEERVQHAADLYKNGYAKNLIFSSGYTYALKEILIMKALAVSMGVPQEAIILEDKAKNTYENVIFTKDILNKEKQKKILLVSSPYHMRRALLVFKKAAKGVDVICAPIPNSVFYAHGATWKQTNIQQIKGILHEYLGILYYWWKGYI